jgi:hypothetical protein
MESASTVKRTTVEERLQALEEKMDRVLVILRKQGLLK